MAKLYNLARMVSSTSGTGSPLTLTTAVSGLLTFAQAGVADGELVDYAVTDGANSEIGYGQVGSSGTTLTRNVTKSTNGNAAISLSGSAQVMITPRAETFYDLIATSKPGGRLTLTSGTAITTADVTAAGTVYFTPADNDRIPIYDGAKWCLWQFAEIALTLNNPNHATNSNYDVFAAISANAVVVGTGPPWTSDTARGTGAGTTEIETFEGRIVNKNAITLRNGSTTYSIAARQAVLLGGFRTTAVAQTEDSAAKRFLSNALNIARRSVIITDATASWTYSTATYRQANGSTANQVAMFFCITGRLADVCVQHSVANSTTTVRTVAFGIGVDSSTVDSSFPLAGINTNPLGAGVIEGRNGFYKGYPGLGYHTLRWLEKGAAADTQTWYGASVDGISGAIWN